MKLTTVLLTLSLAGAAQVALADTGYPYSVRDDAQGGFLVAPKFTNANYAYWCAAGDHARKSLNASASDRVYVLADTNQTSRREIRFGLTPPSSGAVQSSGLSVDLVGNSLRVSQATQYCTNTNIKD